MASVKAEAKAGEAVYKDGETSYVFVTPDLDTYEDYQEKIAGTKRRGPAYRELAQRCLKDQTQLSALQALFARKPAISLAIANTLSEMAGIDAELVVGKG